MLRWISYYDLLSFPKSREALFSDDYGAFLDIMHEVGFDIDKPIVAQDVYVRSYVDLSVQFGRFIGAERSDKEWVGSPYCTLENKIYLANERDTSLGTELALMSRVYNHTGELIRYLEEWHKV